MSNYNVIKPSVVRAIAKDCANTHNGTKKTIDCAVAGYNGIR